MVQVINIRFDGSIEVNWGGFAINTNVENADLPQSFTSIMSSILSKMQQDGISEIHSEKTDFKNFEHVIVAGVVTENQFGTVISLDDFNSVMSQEQEVDLAINPPPPEIPETDPSLEEDPTDPSLEEDPVVTP